MQKRLRTTGFATAAMLIGALLGLVGAPVFAQTEYVMKGYDKTASGDQNWKDATSIPAGAQMIVLYGDPKKEGPYIFRVKFPAGYKVPPHKHQDARVVTVLEGNYWSGVGEKFEQSKLNKFTWGSFYTTAAGVPHFSWAETPVIIQEMGMGPVSDPIEYVNAADDPRKK